MQVDVIQRADRGVIAQGSAQNLEGAIGQHLIHVHVRGGAGAALEGIHLYVRIELALCHLGAGLLDGLECGLIPAAQLVIRAGAGEFHRPVRADKLRMHGPTAEREILQRTLGVNTVKSVGGNIACSQEIMFCSIIFQAAKSQTTNYKLQRSSKPQSG